MNKITRTLLVVMMILAVSSGAFFVFGASNYTTPAEVAAGLIGCTVEDVIAEHDETGRNYGQIAADAGLRNEFIDEMALLREDKIAAKVTSGDITQAQADEIFTLIAAHQALGNGLIAKISQKFGLGRGMMNGFDQNIQVLQDKIAAKVASGALTEDKAAQILALIAERQANFTNTNPDLGTQVKLSMARNMMNSLRQNIGQILKNRTTR